MEQERSLEGKRQELYRQLLNVNGSKNASAVEVADAAQKAAGALISPPPISTPTTTSSSLDMQDSAAQFLERLATQSSAVGGQSYGPAAAQFLEKLAAQSNSSSTVPSPSTAQFLERLAAQSTTLNTTTSTAPIPPAPPAGLPPANTAFGLPPTPPVAPPIQSSLQAALGTNAVGGSAILASISRDPRISSKGAKTPLSPPDSGNVSPAPESPKMEGGEILEGDETVAPVSFGEAAAVEL
jgi:hypothetical protein